jgi:hypothetical protein
MKHQNVIAKRASKSGTKKINILAILAIWQSSYTFEQKN